MKKFPSYTITLTPRNVFFSSIAFVFLLGVMVLAGLGTAALSAGQLAHESQTNSEQKTKEPLPLLSLVRSQKTDEKKSEEIESEARSEEQKQLMVRLEVLQSIIESAIALDLNYEHQHSGDHEDATGTEATPGIGGGDEQADDLAALAPLQDIGLNLHLNKTVNNQLQLIELVDSHLAVLRGLPLGSPVKGWISSAFGKRRSPFTHRLHQHKGMDIAVDKGSRVVATADGLVLEAAGKGSYGKTVRVDHGNGMITLYGHLSKILVKKGDLVCAGQEIGLVGSTGRSTGPHVHYELRFNGVARNPSPFIHAAGLLKAAL